MPDSDQEKITIGDQAYRIDDFPFSDQDAENIMGYITKDDKLYVFEEFCNIYKRDISPHEMVGLLNRYPYLEICDPFADEAQMTRPERHVTQVGWSLVDRGAHMLLGPGRGRFGSYDGEEGEDSGGGVGSIFHEAIVAVEEMLMVAYDRWGEVHILNGHDRLQRMAWIYSKRMVVPLHGFLPTDMDHHRLTQLTLLQEYDVKELIDVVDFDITPQNR